MQTQTVDVPVWMGILMCIAGIALTIALAKWDAYREKKRSQITANSKT